MAETPLIDKIIVFDYEDAFKHELLDKLPELVSYMEETDEIFYNFKGMTPEVINKDGEGMFLARDTEETFNQISSKISSGTILGSYDEVFTDTAKKITYDRIYPRDPIEFIDPETGETITYTPPEKFGVFFDLDET